MVVVPTLHPAALLRGRDEESGLAKFDQTVSLDIGKALRLTRERPKWDERVIWERDSVGRLKNLFPTPEEVIEFCRNALGHPVATDTETTGEQVMVAQMLCAGFASANGTAMCVPFLKRGGTKYWAPHDEQRVRWAVGQLLSSRDTVKIFHNKEFDKIVYWLNGLPVSGPDECCYVDAETEFLTESGWRKYDDVKAGMKLATVSKTGQLEYQNFFHRVAKPFSGPVVTLETAHSRAVVTDNHRMLVRPFYRQRTEPVGEWEFRRAESLGHGSDQFDVRVAFEDERPAIRVEWYDNVRLTDSFMTLLGLWITDGSLAWTRGRLQAFQIHQDPHGPAMPELRRLKIEFNLNEKSQTMLRWRTPKGRLAFQKLVTEVTFWQSNGEWPAAFLRWCGRYSKQRRLPPFVLGLAQNLRAALLKGLLLGDSGVVAGRRIYRTACRSLAGDVQGLALSLGYAATIHWAGGCWGVTLWKRKLDRAGTGAAYGSVTKRKRSVRVVCFSVPNETLVTRSRGKPAFHGNTMQMHHVIDSELPHALGFNMTRELDARYHKDDVKGDAGWLFQDDLILRSYNLRDCLGTRELYPIFSARLDQLGPRLWALYRQECALVALMARATVRGLAVDFWRRDCESLSIPVKDAKGAVIGYTKGLGPKLRDQQWNALGVLRQLAGSSVFDPMKPRQLKELLFTKLRFPVVKLSDSGLHPSTDKEAMVLLALAAGTQEQKLCIKALADFKQAQKFLSTFVEGLKVTGDGRFHPTWKLLTTSGRFASSPNAQNWRKNIKAIFCAGNPRFGPDDTSDEEFSGVDLQQAEMRGIAYDANDQRLLQMYQQNLNVHTVNLSMALKVRPPIGHKDLDAATQLYIEQYLPMQFPGWTFAQLTELTGNALKAGRTLIKNDGFGRNYGGEDEVVFSIMRSARDPDTNELMFPNLKRSEVEANGVLWRKLNVGIVRWWHALLAKVKQQGYYQCPISGRIRWFRGGQKKNDILGTPIQMMIASFVNERTLEIQAVYDRETNGQALIVQQVHDSLNVANPKTYSKRAAQVMTDVISRPVALPGHPNATFPPDKVLHGGWLSDV